jgi:membrane associated rhomboid family serine protease
VLSGFAGVVLSFLFSPYYSWGASGALFGLLGSQAVLAVQNRALFRDGGKSLLWNALSVAGINIMLGFFINADNWGHVGGLLGGAMFAWFAGPQLVITGYYPNMLTFTDQRGSTEVLNAAAFVLLIFGALTAVGIFLLP